MKFYIRKIKPSKLTEFLITIRSFVEANPEEMAKYFAPTRPQDYIKSADFWEHRERFFFKLRDFFTLELAYIPRDHLLVAHDLPMPLQQYFTEVIDTLHADLSKLEVFSTFRKIINKYRKWYWLFGNTDKYAKGSIKARAMVVAKLHRIFTDGKIVFGFPLLRPYYWEETQASAIPETMVRFLNNHGSSCYFQWEDSDANIRAAIVQLEEDEKKNTEKDIELRTALDDEPVILPLSDEEALATVKDALSVFTDHPVEEDESEKEDKEENHSAEEAVSNEPASETISTDSVVELNGDSEDKDHPVEAVEQIDSNDIDEVKEHGASEPVQEAEIRPATDSDFTPAAEPGINAEPEPAPTLTATEIMERWTAMVNEAEPKAETETDEKNDD